MKKLQQANQQQTRPGKEKKMKPIPETDPIIYSQGGKLAGKTALITGGDSGIGKATALLFAKEGADIVIAYLNEKEEALSTKKEIEKFNVNCKIIKGDLSIEKNCRIAVEKSIESFHKIDILINNAALHWESETLEEISTKQLENTFKNNVFSYFWMTKYTLPYMQ
ncbi:SDR family NAD(P)-dependent oxidoreductase, partial [Empedobacter sp.]